MRSPEELDGHFPLHAAAKKGNLEACEQLLTDKKLLFQLDSDGKEPIYYACLGNSEEHAGVVAFLVKQGSNLVWYKVKEPCCLLDITVQPTIKDFLKNAILKRLAKPTASQNQLEAWALLISLYKLYQGFSKLSLNEKNLRLLNSVKLSDELYASLVYEAFIKNYVGVDIITDEVGCNACKRVLSYCEESNVLPLAALCARLIGFYYCDPLEQPENGLEFLDKAYKHYHTINDRKAFEVLEDYAHHNDNAPVCAKLYKDILCRNLRNVESEFDQEDLDCLVSALILTNNTREIAVYGLLNSFIRKEETTPEKITEFKRVMKEEVRAYGKPYCLFDKKDLSIIVNLIKLLSPVQQAEFSEITKTIIPLVSQIPSLKNMIFNFLLRTNYMAEQAKQLVCIPRSQLQFFQQSYQSQVKVRQIENAKSLSHPVEKTKAP